MSCVLITWSLLGARCHLPRDLDCCNGWGWGRSKSHFYNPELQSKCCSFVQHHMRTRNMHGKISVLFVIRYWGWFLFGSKTPIIPVSTLVGWVPWLSCKTWCHFLRETQLHQRTCSPFPSMQRWLVRPSRCVNYWNCETKSINSEEWVEHASQVNGSSTTSFRAKKQVAGRESDDCDICRHVIRAKLLLVIPYNPELDCRIPQSRKTR